MQKTILYSVVLAVLWVLPCTKLQAQAGNSDKVFVVVDKEAKYRDEELDLRIYFIAALSQAFEHFERHGTANVTMIITKTGEVKDPVITYSNLTPAMDAAILKAASDMPIWEPARVGGYAVNSRVTFPVEVSTFRMRYNPQAYTEPPIQTDVPYAYVEVMPSFPGGPDALMKFISKNLKYPEAELKNKIQGTEYVSFTVTPTGEIKDIKFLKSLGKNFENEVRRLLSIMPRWHAGKQSGTPVPVTFNLPVRFNPPAK